MPRHLKTGEWGEQVAEDLLKRKKYRILGRRVRAGRRQELDLVALSPERALVFVEVKTRGSEVYGRPIASVGARKREQVSRAAIAYLRRLRVKPDHFRFDVIEVVGHEGGPPPVIRHIENAFPLAGNRRIPW